MTTTTEKLNTASTLLAACSPLGPAVERDEFVLRAEPSAELLRLLEVLHTGIRAALIGRKWYGSTSADGLRPRVIELDPAKPIPLRIDLLCVEGDQCWDRLHPDARIDFPTLFETTDPKATR